MSLNSDYLKTSKGVFFYHVTQLASKMSQDSTCQTSLNLHIPSSYHLFSSLSMSYSPQEVDFLFLYKNFAALFSQVYESVTKGEGVEYLFFKTLN